MKQNADLKRRVAILGSVEAIGKQKKAIEYCNQGMSADSAIFLLSHSQKDEACRSAKLLVA